MTTSNSGAFFSFYFGGHVKKKRKKEQNLKKKINPKKERTCSCWVTLAQWGGNRSSESHPACHACTPKTIWLEAHAPECTVVLQWLQCCQLFPLPCKVRRVNQGARGVKNPCAAVEGGNGGSSGGGPSPWSWGGGRGCFSCTCRFGATGTF